MVLKAEMDALANKIREGISKHGLHLIYKADLEKFFGDEILTEESIRLNIEKFCKTYGFTAKFSAKQMTAMFRGVA